MKDDVTGEDELALFCSRIISGRIVGVLYAYLPELVLSQGVKIVAALMPVVADAGVEGGLGIGLADPRGDVVTGGQANLHHPVIVELGGDVDAGLSVGVEGVENRVAVSIVVGCELRFDVGQGNIAADAHVHALGDLPPDSFGTNTMILMIPPARRYLRAAEDEQEAGSSSEEDAG